MIELAQAVITINAPVDAVFNYTIDMENYKNWFPGVVNIKSLNDLNHGVLGKTYIETLSLPGGDAELTIEVDQCEQSRLFLTKGNLKGVLPQMTILFSANDEHECDIQLQYHARYPELMDNDELVLMLREDLNVRANLGLKKLKLIMEGNYQIADSIA